MTQYILHYTKVHAIAVSCITAQHVGKCSYFRRFWWGSVLPPCTLLVNRHLQLHVKVPVIKGSMLQEEHQSSSRVKEMSYDSNCSGPFEQLQVTTKSQSDITQCLSKTKKKLTSRTRPQLDTVVTPRYKDAFFVARLSDAWECYWHYGFTLLRFLQQQ